MSDRCILYYEALKAEAHYDENITFKATIQNNTKSPINNICIESIFSYEFDSKYYEFSKNSKDIEIINKEGIITINELNSGEEVIVFISVCVRENLDSDVLLSYTNVSYRAAGRNIKQRSNEVSVFLHKKSGCLINVDLDKEIADIGEEIEIAMEIINVASVGIKEALLSNIIPKGCIFVIDSLYINNTYIQTVKDVINIRLGDIRPLQKIFIRFKFKVLSNEQENIKHRCSMNYNLNGICNVSSHSNLYNIKLRCPKVDFSIECERKEYLVDENIGLVCNIENIGNVELYELSLIDVSEKILNYINGTMCINKFSTSVSLEKGLYVEKLEPNESLSIKCDIIENKACDLNGELNLSYKYMGKNNISIFESVDKEIKCKVIDVDLVIKTKIKSNRNIFIGDNIENFIEISNQGNVESKDLTLYMDIDNYIEESLNIDNIKPKGYDFRKLKIGTLIAGESIKINYKTVADFNDYTKVNQSRFLTYNFLVGSRLISRKLNIKEDDFILRKAEINIENCLKTISSNNIGIGDIITVSFEILNKGNYTAKKVFIKESMIKELRFVAGSLIINGVEEEFDIEEGFYIDNIKSGEKVFINYKLKAVLLSFTKVCISSTEVSYRIDDNRSETLKIMSEGIWIESAIIDSEIGLISREIDTEVLSEGDFADFNLSIRNSGNRDAHNVYLKENITDALAIIGEGSINGKKLNFEECGVNIGTIKAGEDIEIVYRVQVIEKETRVIETYSDIEYIYYRKHDKKIIKRSSESNRVNVLIENIKFLSKISIDKKEVDLEEELNYDLYIKNISGFKLKNLSLTLTDNLGDIIYIKKCSINNKIIDINTLRQIDFYEDFDDKEAKVINIALAIKKAKDKSKIKLRPIFKGSYISNSGDVKLFEYKGEEEELKIFYNPISIEIKNKTESYLKGEEVDFLVLLKNEGNQNIKNILLVNDDLNNILVDGSLNINGIYPKKIYLSGISIESLGANECKFIRYKAIYNTDFTNIVKTKFKFYGENIIGNKVEKIEFESEEHSLKLNTLQVEISKAANKNMVENNDLLEVSTTIFNKGDIDIKNLRILEVANKEFCLRKTKIINDKFIYDANSSNGEIDILRSGQFCEIVNEYKYTGRKSNQKFFIKGELKYLYKEAQENILTCKNVVIFSKSNTCKDVFIEHEIKGTSSDYEISEIVDCILDIKIISSYVINTIKSDIYKDSKATGKKLIIRGYLDEKFEYIDTTVDEQVRILSNREIFSTSIVVDESISLDKNIRINTKVNEIFFKLVDSKTIIANAAISLEAII